MATTTPDDRTAATPSTHRRPRRRRPARRRGRARASPSCSPTASPSSPTRGATSSPALAAAGYRVRRPRPAGLRPLERAPRRSRTTTSSTSPATCSACSTTSARSGRCSSATTGARWSCGTLALLAPRAGRRRRRHERAVPAPRARCRRSQLMRQVFGDTFFYILYFQEPGVADAELGARPGHDHAAHARAALMPTEGAAPDPSFFANDGRGFVDRMPEPDGLPDWLTPGRARPLRRRVRPAPASPAASTGTATSTATGSSPSTSPAPRSRCRRCSSAARSTRCC